MLQVAIVEDEAPVAAQMTKYLKKYGEDNGEEFNIVHFESATALLENYKPVWDIIFMDILLPYMNGMVASKKLRAKDGEVSLVFVTNMAKFAVKGYEVDAIDFIVKPVSYAAFAFKMERIMRITKLRKKCTVSIFARDVKKNIAVSEIVYFESDKHVIKCHMCSGEVFLFRDSMKNVEESVKEAAFSRCSVSYLVNLAYVEEADKESVKVHGEQLYFSRTRKKEFLEDLAKFLGQRS